MAQDATRDISCATNVADKSVVVDRGLTPTATVLRGYAAKQLFKFYYSFELEGDIIDRGKTIY